MLIAASSLFRYALSRHHLLFKELQEFELQFGKLTINVQVKTLDFAVKEFPKDRQGKISKEYLCVALDTIAPSVGLPPICAVDQFYYNFCSNLEDIIWKPPQESSKSRVTKMQSKRSLDENYSWDVDLGTGSENPHPETPPFSTTEMRCAANPEG